MSTLFGSVSLSVLVPTHARSRALRRCLMTVRTSVRSSHEIIVVGVDREKIDDPALKHMPGVSFVAEDRRHGAAQALNAGLEIATGRFVVWLHDDSWPLPGAIDAALRAIKGPDFTDVGMIAFYQTNPPAAAARVDSFSYSGGVYSLCELNGQVFSNFGLARREIFDHDGGFDERFFLRGWDIDLALRVQTVHKQRVVGLREAMIAHDAARDTRRMEDEHMVERDMQRLNTKWHSAAPVTPTAAPAAAPAPSIAASPASRLVRSPLFGMPKLASPPTTGAARAPLTSLAARPAATRTA